MTSKIIYPGTFDPMTLGHMDIVERAVKQFDTVIVAVADSRLKKPWLPLEQRVDMAQRACTHLTRVEVRRFEGLLVDFARAQGAHLVLRGLRTSDDLNYELELARMNHTMDAECETIFMASSSQYVSISGRMVREIALLKGDLSGFVPPVVNECLRKF